MQSLLPVPSVMEVLCAAWSCARIRLLPCSFSPCSCWMYWLCWLSRNKFAAAKQHRFGQVTRLLLRSWSSSLSFFLRLAQDVPHNL